MVAGDLQQQMQSLAGKDVTNWNRLHTFAPETSSVLELKLIGILSEEDFKEGGDALRICPLFDVTKVVLIFPWCAKTCGWIKKFSICGRRPGLPVKLQTTELMQKCSSFKCHGLDASVQGLIFTGNVWSRGAKHQKQTNKILSLTFANLIDNISFSLSLKERFLCVSLSLFNKNFYQDSKQNNRLKATNVSKSYSLQAFGIKLQQNMELNRFSLSAIDFTGSRKMSVLIQQRRKQDC